VKKRLVVYKSLPEPLLAELRQRFDVAYFEWIDDSNRGHFAAAVRDAHGMIGANAKLDEALLASAPLLEAISTISAGIDKIDIEYLTERGIVLSNIPDAPTEATADLIFALMLSCARRVVEMAEFVKAGQWRHTVDPALYGTDVHGKTLGIVGMGRIGQAVARRARFGFGMNILYYSRSPALDAEKEFSARSLSLDEVLAHSDFVCLTVPLTAATNKLIGAREFPLMKSSAIFINASRGAIVDEAALIEALHNGTIRAAGLDVFEQEPLRADSPLLKMNNVVALPHIGSATHETRYAMAQRAVENIIAALDGKPQSVANPAVLKQRAAPRQ